MRAGRNAWRKTLRSLPRPRHRRRRRTVEEFWALKDVGFEVKRGEVLGIIGRNGAGKSTLLKILSRITEPSEGRVTIKGRVASLLEVGTGFHPELTGRENIYLNGAVLGMTRAEIRRKFDEIVAFAEVEKFLDTPVKRYSCGMYVRLAFAVAAHLEPEILIVDEVLAVGDAEFQKKCLGKIGGIANGGRTVLFVSHSMPAISSLCSRALFVKGGRCEFDGATEEAVALYSALDQSGKTVQSWSYNQAPGDSSLRLLQISVRQPGSIGSFNSAHPITVCMDVICQKNPDKDLCIGFELFDRKGASLWWSYHTDGYKDDWPIVKEGRNRLLCSLPANLFNSGLYQIAPRISVHNRGAIVHLPPIIEFNVDLAHGRSPYWTALSPSPRLGQLAPILNWTLNPISDNASSPIGIPS